MSCAGGEETFEIVESVISVYAKAVNLIGPVGSGQTTKMVNQICIAGLVQSLSEGLDFGRRAGLDMEKVIAAEIGKERLVLGRCQTDRRCWNERWSHGFALDWMRKDLDIVFNEASRIGAKLPITAMVDEYYAQLQDQGHGRWDTSSPLGLLRVAPNTNLEFLTTVVRFNSLLWPA